MRISWVLVACGFVFSLVQFVMPLASLAYVADIKNECESAIFEAAKLPLHEIERLAEKQIREGCARGQALVGAIQSVVR